MSKVQIVNEGEGGPERSMSSAGVVTVWECEQIVEHLASVELSDYGSRMWMRQHEWIEKLNIQAHHNVHTKRDEFVMEHLISHEKIGELIKELLVADAWKTRVMPHLEEEMANCQGVKAHALMYHEASIVNLLEVILYHAEPVESAGDMLIELIDYCQRKLVALYSDPNLAPPPEEGKSSASELATRTSLDAWRTQRDEMEWSIRMICLSLIRFVTDRIGDLPLSSLNRVIITDDFISLLVTLIERQPWLVRRKGNKCFKWIDGKWMKIDPSDVRRLCGPEAQAWLALNNLLCDQEARKHLPIDAQRKATVARLRPYISEALLDQIPVLKDLARAIEEVQVLDAPEAATARNPLLVEQVPVVRDSLMAQDAEEIADKHRDSIFSQSESERREEMESFAKLYNLDAIEDLLERPICSKCGKPAVKRCSRCSFQWYCGRACQVADWKTHKPVCEMLKESKEQKKQ